MNYPYRIPYSTKKSYINGILCLLLTLGAALPLISKLIAGESSTLSIFLMIALTIGLLFFGYAAYTHFQMLYSGKLAVEIDDEGIREETSKLSQGLVRWEDIIGMREYSTFGAKFIVIDVKNPEYYHSRARSGVARRLMKQNESMVGSPITINMGNIKIKPQELLHLLQEEWKFQQSLRSGPGTPLPELIRLRNELGTLRTNG